MDADPLYAAYHYSHPILPERLSALQWDSKAKSAKKPEDSGMPAKAADREL
jgi:STE24 endopeptidase